MDLERDMRRRMRMILGLMEGIRRDIIRHGPKGDNTLAGRTVREMTDSYATLRKELAAIRDALGEAE